MSVLLIIHRHLSSRSRIRWVFLANVLLRLHAEVEDVFPAGRRLRAVSGEREAGDTRSRALQSGKPNTHCWRDPCYSLIHDMQRQTERTRNPVQTGGAELCIPTKRNFSTFSLSTVTHFMDPATVQTVDRQLFSDTSANEW